MDIPGFKLGRQYAEGPYCKGYNALNLSNHKTVNIQVFDSAQFSTPTFIEQFREITSRLTGAGFGIMTPILQAEISEQGAYVISEYFPGPQQLPAAPPHLTRYECLHFALQLAQTLSQLHTAGLVHGSIEYGCLDFRATDMLMLRPVMLQRVLPMLRPTALESLDQTQRQYLAPEAYEELTPATDYYALGVLLYQLLFDSLPFDADAPGVLNADPFKGEHRDLEPFFRQLLAPDAGYRIRSLDQFNAALRQCGIELSGSAPAASAAIPGQRDLLRDGERTSRAVSKWMLPVAGVVVAAVASSLYLLLPREQAQKQPERPAAAEMAPGETARATADPAALNPALAENPSGETRSNLESLYQQASIQLETDPQAALQTVNALLDLKPSYIKAMKLRLRIEREISVRKIIDTAARQIEEQKLLQPSGDNAYESYQLLADKLSPDDERVRSGFTRIAVAYQDMANKLVEQNRLEKALKQVELGLSVSADYPPLIDLRMRINEQISALERKQRQARLDRQQSLEERQQVKQRQQAAQQRRLEQQRQDEQQVSQQEEQASQNKDPAQIAEQIARQLEAEQIKQARINALLASANGYLNRNELSLDNVLSAHLKYDELLNFDSNDEKVNRLQKDLIDAYSILGSRENNEHLYALALQALKQGVQMSPRERKKLLIRVQFAR